MIIRIIMIKKSKKFKFINERIEIKNQNRNL